MESTKLTRRAMLGMLSGTAALSTATPVFSTTGTGEAGSNGDSTLTPLDAETEKSAVDGTDATDETDEIVPRNIDGTARTVIQVIEHGGDPIENAAVTATADPLGTPPGDSITKSTDRCGKVEIALPADETVGVEATSDGFFSESRLITGGEDARVSLVSLAGETEPETQPEG